MPSTPSSRNRLNRQGTGDNVGSWGAVLNAQVFDLVDEALDGVATITVTGNLTLSSANYATDQARRRVLKLIGTPGASFILTIPSVEKYYIVHNQTLDAQTIKASGIGVSVPANTMLLVVCDGTDCFAPTVGLAAEVGTVVDYAGATAPSGWLLCYGQAISRTTYSSLFLRISTAYGAGDGSTTFNIPDYRGRTGFGLDNMGGTATSRVTAFSGVAGTTLGATGGSEALQAHTHPVSVSDPGHFHSITDPTHSHGYSEGTGGLGHRHSYNEPAGVVGVTPGSGFSVFSSTSPSGITAYATTGIVISANATGIGINTNTTGISALATTRGIGSSENMPPCIMINKIIYAGV